VSDAVVPSPTTLSGDRPTHRHIPGWLLAFGGMALALAVLLAVRHRVGGVDQWMLPVLATVQAAYGLGFVLFLLALRLPTLRPAVWAVLAGFLASAFLVTTRGLEAGRWPSQSKFEVFFNTSLTVPAVLLVLFARFSLAGAEGRRRVVAALVGAVTTGFALLWVRIASKEDYDIQELPPALQSGWFPPHVTSYMLAYSAVFAAALVAGLHLIAARSAARRGLAVGRGTLAADLDGLVYGIVAVGFTLLSSGLFLGALWGEAAWADYWFWDIKETWAFLSWLAMLAYLHVRMVAGWSGTRSSWIVLLGAVFIAITYVGVQLLPASISSEHVYN
jgi:cytochrome c-type biogenesis protein CcsB